MSTFADIRTQRVKVKYWVGLFNSWAPPLNTLGDARRPTPLPTLVCVSDSNFKQELLTGSS